MLRGLRIIYLSTKHLYFVQKYRQHCAKPSTRLSTSQQQEDRSSTSNYDFATESGAFDFMFMKGNMATGIRLTSLGD